MDKILTKAILVKLSIGQFNPKRQDAKVTSEVLNKKNANTTAGVWMKNLIDPKALEGITATGQAARLEHYKLSLPWQDEGIRMLPINMFFEYKNAIRDYEAKYRAQVDKFVAQYPQFIEDARVALKDMFNPNDYPTQAQVAEKFFFKVSYAPLPCGNDFRISLASDELAAIQQDVDKRVEEATAQAVRDLWNRVAQPLKNIVERLSDPKAIFRDSLIVNVQEIVKLIPSLNLTNDPKLDEVVSEIKGSIARLEPEVLRKDTTARSAAAEEAQAILTKLEGYI